MSARRTSHCAPNTHTMCCYAQSCIYKLHAVLLQLVPLGMPLLHTLTEREADNFGIFLREVLQSIQGWWVSSCLDHITSHCGIGTEHSMLQDCLRLMGFACSRRVKMHSVCCAQCACSQAATLGYACVPICTQSFWQTEAPMCSLNLIQTTVMQYRQLPPVLPCFPTPCLRSRGKAALPLWFSV